MELMNLHGVSGKLVNLRLGKIGCLQKVYSGKTDSVDHLNRLSDV